jgi:Zn-dependent protease/predicted transcriptional regulator
MSKPFGVRKSWHLCKIRGIDIFIDSSWLIIFILVTWTLASHYFPSQNPDVPLLFNWVLGIIASLLFFASVLAHELSHSLVAQQQGEQVKNITLFIFGGVAQIGNEPDKPLKEFLIAFVGPLTSIAIGVISYGTWWILEGITPPFASIFRYLGFINIALACFNLVPGFPLDGGRILRAVIWGITKNVKVATRIASLSGKVVAFLLIFLGIWMIFTGLTLNGIWMIFIGWFLYNAAMNSYRHLLVKDALHEIRVEDLMITDFGTVSPHITIQQLVDDYILRHKDRGFLVIEEGLVKGIVCLHDVKQVPREQWSTATIGSIMIPQDQLEKVAPRDDASIALNKLTARNIHQVPVVQANKVMGILRRNDILNYLQLHNDLGTKVG